ncbi:MAG: 23S rRNA (adenine(2503)-C(2))-methyltransferase RlmN, partial [Oscillospiraceae bacterium]|nr:23S rRNA (adenine(2503)-C(2))-methyltransferase RlmN [Oscillospiraceae bacterium]
IMKINHRWNIEKLLEACKHYAKVTGTRISFEYALIKGQSDTPEDAVKLASLLKGMLCHVNLIPVNEISERDYKRSDDKGIKKFVEILESRGITTTVRRKLGADINAACGQLRAEHSKESEV